MASLRLLDGRGGVMTVSLSLDGKVAIVTGGARGMGAATVRRLVEAGAHVVITDRLEDLGRALESELGSGTRFVTHDVSSEASWSDVLETTLREFGHVNILINNAGIWRTSPLALQSVDDFDEILAINLRGAFLGMKCVAQAMSAAGGGAIVNISSAAGLVGLEDMIAYGASKWGVRGITRIAALELGRHGVRVNSVHPGGVATPMTAAAIESGGNYLDHIPLGRIGSPADIANLNLFLVSDLAAWISGAEITIDGGTFAGGYH
jgi:3alpha(or 20beta)-hydroxysteroid dehydrogenase